MMKSSLLPSLICLVAGVASAEGTKLLRYPDIHGETVVFSYAGDLWRTSIEGGSATRLTAHPGLEIFPKFSRDGRWIAFTGQYDGGSVSVPQFAFADASGRWVIEGQGMEPDIEVESDPALLIEGRDSQLERAIEEVLKTLEMQPGTLPGQSPDPDKTE